MFWLLYFVDKVVDIFLIFMDGVLVFIVVNVYFICISFLEGLNYKL